MTGIHCIDNEQEILEVIEAIDQGLVLVLG